MRSPSPRLIFSVRTVLGVVLFSLIGNYLFGGPKWVNIALIVVFVPLVITFMVMSLMVMINPGGIVKKDALNCWFGATAAVSDLSDLDVLVLGKPIAGCAADRLAITDAVPVRPHALIVASTGSGKTTSLIRPNILAHSGAVLALDVKGEICTADAAALAESGRTVRVFDPEGVIGELPAGVQRVALDLQSGWEEAAGDWQSRFAQSFADLIFIEQSADPAFAGSARILGRSTIAASIVPELREKDAGGLFAALARSAMRPHRKLNSLFEPKKQQGLDLSADLRRLIEEGSVFLTGNNQRFIDAGLAGMRRQLEFLNSERIVAALDGDWRLDQLLEADSKAVLLLVLPAARLPHYAPLLRLIFGSIGVVAETRSATATPANLLVAIDEAATLEKADWLLQGAALHRSAGITYMLAFQSCSQIERIYGKTGVAEFMGNCTNVFLGVRDFDTAQVLSQALGETTAESIDRSLGNKSDMSVRQLSAPVATAQEILQMDANELIVLPPSGKAARLRRVAPGVLAGK